MLHIGQEKAPALIEKGPVSPIDKLSANNPQYPKTESGCVKYMQEVEAWFDSIIRRGDQETDEQYRKRVLNALKMKLAESYRSGRKFLAA